MKEMKFKLPGPETIMLTGQAIDKLINAGDGDAALLYLHILKTRGQSTPAQAAAALRKKQSGIDAAMAVLSRLGLAHLDGPAQEDLCESHGMPQEEEEQTQSGQEEAEEQSPSGLEEPDDQQRRFTVQDMKRELDEGSVFGSIVEEAQRSLGKMLSPDDLLKLFGVYDALRMAPEVILLLITHCITESRAKKGGRMPSMRHIEKTAYSWEREGILTLEKAEEHLKALEFRKSAHGEMKKVLQVRDRDFSESERKYADSWIEMGFGAAAVAIAYDRTIVNTGKPALRYMDSIINNWHEKGLHTPKEILSKDRRTGKNNGPGKPQAHGEKFGSADHEDIERMTRLLNKIKEE